MKGLLCILIGYGVGCIQSAYVVGKMMHVDLRQHGSGNLGSTNALRVLGKRAGAITFLCDILKSALSFILCRMLFQDMGILAGMLGSLGAVLGHDFPFYLQFKGGKGIAAMIGMVACLIPTVPLLAVFGYGAGILGILLTKTVSFGSLFFSVVIPLVLFFTKCPMEMVLVGVAMMGLAFYRHKENIVRLCNGTENKLGSKKKHEGGTTV